MKTDKRRIGMRHRNSLIVALALLGAVLFQKELLAADVHGNIEVGATQVGIDSPSSKFMEYGGARNNGTYLSGGAELSYNDNAFYLNLMGKDLGLDTRDIRLESGKYGRYRFYIEYDQLPHYISNNSQTIYDGAGTANLTLPASFGKGTNTTTPLTAGQTLMTNLSSNLKDVELKLERKDISTGFSLTSLKGLLDFDLDFKRDKKDGIKSIGATLSRVGGSVMPEPVDYTTDELRASVAYNRKAAQVQLEYYLSTFNNGNDSLKWENPFSASYGNPALSLPPDNNYQRVTLSGGVNLPLYSRLSMTAEYGKMTQDQAYMPYHANSYSTADAAGNYPRMSPDAAIETKLLNVNLSSRPLSGLGLNAGYRHYDTQNLTPIGLYQYTGEDGSTLVTSGAAQPGDVGIDGKTQVTGTCTTVAGGNPCYRPNGQPSLIVSGAAIAGDLRSNGTSAFPGACSQATPCYRSIAVSSSARYNVPLDYIQDQAKLDASYTIARSTTLSAGYGRDIMMRSHRETSTTTEDSYKAGIKSNTSYAAIGGDYLKGVRSSGDYNGAVVLESYTQDYFNQTLNTGTNARTWINLPELRILDVADRDRERYNAFVTVFPLNNASLGLNYSHGKDDFNDTIIGLKDLKNETYTVNVTVDPSDTVSMYTYYTNDWSEANQSGRAVGTASTTWTDTTLDWSVNNDDRTDTVGAGLNLQFLRGKLTINPDYTYSKSNTAIAVHYTGATALPDLKTERHTVNISTKYKVTENVTLGAAYLFERYSSSDWSTDSLNLSDPSTFPTNLIPLSGSVPDYTANAGTITLAYKW